MSWDFTAKIGGYLSSDWSHMFFKTKHGTKVTIKSEAIENDHIEPYVPPAINDNLSILDKEEYPMAKKFDTQVDGILDMILDEWAAENNQDLVNKQL